MTKSSDELIITTSTTTNKIISHYLNITSTCTMA